MCAKELILPLNVTRYAHLFDLKDSGDDFYFDNVTAYVRRVMADIEKLSFDETYKREIRLTARLIELGSEVCKVKLHPQASAGQAKALDDGYDKEKAVAADHNKIAVREVNKFYNTVNHGVAKRNQRIYASKSQSGK